MIKVVVRHLGAKKVAGRREYSPGTAPAFNTGNSTTSSRASSRSTSPRENCSSEHDEYEEEIPEEEADGNSLPTGLDVWLQFQNLSYAVQHSNVLCRTCRLKVHRYTPDYFDHTADTGEVKILQNVSGVVKSGEILAVIGPSGSGKSTLIDVLAQRIARDSIQGSITLNGEEVTSNNIIRRISAYVMQEDLLFPMLTGE
jgi:ABC-type multidrug transport system fused ATPase/permease subunit